MSNFTHTGMAAIKSATTHSPCSANKNKRKVGEGLSVSNNGFADFSKDGVVAGGGVRLI